MAFFGGAHTIWRRLTRRCLTCGTKLIERRCPHCDDGCSTRGCRRCWGMHVLGDYLVPPG